MTGQVQIYFWKSFLDSIDEEHTPSVAWKRFLTKIKKRELDLSHDHVLQIFAKNYIKAYEWKSDDKLISNENAGIYHLLTILNHNIQIQ